MPRYCFDVFDGVGMLAATVGDEFDDEAADQAVSLISELIRITSTKSTTSRSRRASATEMGW